MRAKGGAAEVFPAVADMPAKARPVERMEGTPRRHAKAGKAFQAVGQAVARKVAADSLH